MIRRAIPFALLSLVVSVSETLSAPPAMELEGVWVVTSSEQDGKPFSAPSKGTRFTFADAKVTVNPKKGEGKVLYSFKTDPKLSPKAIDLTVDEGKKKITMRGIYRVEKDRLLLCIGVAIGGDGMKDAESKRPAEFKSGPKTQLMIFERGER